MLNDNKNWCLGVRRPVMDDMSWFYKGPYLVSASICYWYRLTTSISYWYNAKIWRIMIYVRSRSYWADGLHTSLLDSRNIDRWVATIVAIQIYWYGRAKQGGSSGSGNNCSSNSSRREAYTEMPELEGHPSSQATILSWCAHIMPER